MANWLPGFDLSRRDFLKLSAAGVSAASLSGWLPVLAARAASCWRKTGRQTTPLPIFVSAGNRSTGSASLGARHQPLIVNDPARGVENLRPAIAASQFNSRVGLLEEMEQGFNRTHPSGV